MPIRFNFNSNKAQQVLLWVINKKPGINIYNIMKVVFAADKYHLNHYASPIYGDSYEACEYGTVPILMYGLASIKNNAIYSRVPGSPNALVCDVKPDMDGFSQTELEALEYGFSEYGNLSFNEAKNKNHKDPVWKKHEKEIKERKQHVAIPFEDQDFITDAEIRNYLTDVSSAMVF
jgi:uncharacterized phage-associated protein